MMQKSCPDKFQQKQKQTSEGLRLSFAKHNKMNLCSAFDKRIQGQRGDKKVQKQN